MVVGDRTSPDDHMLQGVSGRILFGERLPPMWFCGASLVIAGVLLMVGSTDSSTDSNTDDESDDKKTGNDANKMRRNIDYSPPKTRSKRSTNSTSDGKHDDKKAGHGANRIRRNMDYSPPKTRSKRGQR